ncbi:MAG TPA: hypothetical protein VMV44_12615 [Rectinemataceae bacterium]|nr:hypothetical protein [Rectinemataceae bacterium]
MREFTGPEQFAGALVALAATTAGAGSFMISPGDIDPPSPIRASIDGLLGAGFPWFPLVGNHEAETPSSVSRSLMQDSACWRF